MTDLADEIYEATGMVLGTQQAAAMTRFVLARVAAARREALEEAAQEAKALTDAWRNLQQRHGVAFGEAITGTIRALLEEKPHA